jgi:hypothetical protein
VILNASLCEMNRMAIVPANEFFELDAPAIFRDLAKAILLRALTLNEPRRRATYSLVTLGLPGAADVCLSGKIGSKRRRAETTRLTYNGLGAVVVRSS